MRFAFLCAAPRYPDGKVLLIFSFRNQSQNPSHVGWKGPLEIIQCLNALTVKKCFLVLR